jgi:hypothetical protein
MEVRHIGKRGAAIEGDVPRYSYHAQLVTTEPRRMSGKRRQRIMAYLGSYQIGEQDDVEARIEFWRSVEQRLAVLDVGDEVKARIVASLAERMPRPTADEVMNEIPSARAVGQTADAP